MNNFKEKSEHFLDLIKEMQENFKTINRNSTERQHLLTIRYTHQFFKTSMAKKIITYLYSSTDLSSCVHSLNCLNNLGLMLSKEILVNLWSHLWKTLKGKNIPCKYEEIIVNFFNNQSFSIDQQFAKKYSYNFPEIDIKIPPLKRTKWGKDKWTRLSELSNYSFQGCGVLYRGIYLEPGDIFVQIQNVSDLGFLSCLSSPKRYLSHCSFFAILNKNHKKFPCAIEYHEDGIRAVPLCSELNPRKILYTEIFRLKNKDKKFSERFNKEVEYILEGDKPYDLSCSPDSTDHMTCSRLGEILFRKLGYHEPINKSHLNSNCFSNLSRFGLENNIILTPSDWVFDSNYQFIDSLDSCAFSYLLTGEIVHNAVNKLFQERIINLKNLPFLYKIYEYLFNKIYRGNNLIGTCVMRLYGYKKNTFPYGPPSLLALYLIMLSNIKNLISKNKLIISDHIEKNNNEISFNLEEFMEKELSKFIHNDVIISLENLLFKNCGSVLKESNA